MTKYIISKDEAKEARHLIKQETDKKIILRLQVIALRGEGMKYKEIAQVTGFSKNHLTTILSKYAKDGFSSLLTDNRTGNNRKVSFPQEEEFLAKYSERAENGEILTVKAMKQDFEKEFHVTIEKTSFYQLLHRHGWRKIMPRREHPKKASAEEMERSKKLTQNTESK